MQIQTEHACAVPLSSGLPRLLWEEAMKHAAWLQDRLPSRALNGKTPYEMGHKKKPNLHGIQEFGAATYVKDLSTRKLDARAKKGCLVGYDSESKGFRIYWPEKRSIMVKHDVVFNQEDANASNKIAIIHSVTQSEGENEKNHPGHTE